MDCPQFPIILVLGETAPPKNIVPWNEKKERPLLVTLSPNANVKRQRQAFGTFGSDASLLVTLWIVHGWCRCSGIHGRPWLGAVCSMASTGHLETWNQNDLITQLHLIGTQKTTVESKSTNWSTEEFWENVQLGNSSKRVQRLFLLSKCHSNKFGLCGWMATLVGEQGWFGRKTFWWFKFPWLTFLIFFEEVTLFRK